MKSLLASSLMCVLFVTEISYAEITQTDFNEVIDQFNELYESRLSSSSLTLVLKPIWTPGGIIAFSSARIIPHTKEALVQIDGSFAKKPESNRESFVLLVCHEFGHIYLDHKEPFKLKKEANADRYASACAYDFFSHYPSENTDSKFPSSIRSQCSKFERPELCHNVLAGISSFARTFKVDLSTIETKQASDYVRSFGLHPKDSCRVKIMLAGLFKEDSPDCAYSIESEVKISELRAIKSTELKKEELKRQLLIIALTSTP